MMGQCYGQHLDSLDASPWRRRRLHSFPNAEFWSNSSYPDIDYADLHAYVSTGWGLTAAFVSSSRLETRSAYVRTGTASAHLAGTDNGNEAITPRGLVIHGPGEWIVRYWMKASSFAATCSFGSTGGMQRVRWQVDGGAYWGVEGVVPAEGKTLVHVAWGMGDGPRSAATATSAALSCPDLPADLDGQRPA
jgi:hypothetical protein